MTDFTVLPILTDVRLVKANALFSSTRIGLLIGKCPLIEKYLKAPY